MNLFNPKNSRSQSHISAGELADDYQQALHQALTNTFNRIDISCAPELASGNGRFMTADIGCKA